MPLKLTQSERDAALASIRRFFAEVLDEEIGTLKAQQVLGFVVREIGPLAYNHAIRDAQTFFRERAEDLDGSCFEPEFPYWRDDAPGAGA